MVGFSVNDTAPSRGTLRRPAGNTGRVKRFARVIFSTIALGGIADGHTADEARALAERAAAHIQDVGREQGFADFSRPDGGFVDGALYVVGLDVTGVVVAQGGNPKRVGRNRMDVRGPSGRLANVEVIQLGVSQGSGWAECRWPDPVTKRIELKDAYVLKVDDHAVCGSGIYQGAPA